MRKKFVFILFLMPILAFAEHYEVAVIGSGPAGLSAALVTAKEKHSTMVFLGNKPGGPLNAITCMGNWPGSVKGKGKVVMERLFYQTKKKGAKYTHHAIEHVDFSTRPFQLTSDDGILHTAGSVIIASGSSPRRLGLENEDLYFNKSIEVYVYKTDSERFTGKRVAVVGGGIDAVKKACILAKTSDKVYLIVRRDHIQKPRWHKRIKNKENIEILYETEVTGLIGDGEKLTHVTLSTDENPLQVDNLILALGIEPRSALFKDQLDVDNRGYILLDGRSQKTSVPGVFAAGTVTDPTYRQAAISAGDGMKAGYDAAEWLKSISP